MSQDMGPHISDSHRLCSVDILSSQHTLACNLVGCQYSWVDMNTHPVHLLLYTDCLAHMEMDCKGHQVLLAQLYQFKQKVGESENEYCNIYNNGTTSIMFESI
jgi:hypothetical protein